MKPIDTSQEESKKDEDEDLEDQLLYYLDQQQQIKKEINRLHSIRKLNSPRNHSKVNINVNLLESAETFGYKEPNQEENDPTEW